MGSDGRTFSDEVQHAYDKALEHEREMTFQRLVAKDHMEEACAAIEDADRLYDALVRVTEVGDRAAVQVAEAALAATHERTPISEIPRVTEATAPSREDETT